MDRILVIGYGNVDRQDDGVAWHVLNGLAARMGRPPGAEPGEGFQASGSSTDLHFNLQLVPELAELIAGYTRVCFIDAHTGSVNEDLHIENLGPGYQASAFTHHMTPQTCLELARSIYAKQPEAVLVSIRGYEFGFARELSERTASLAPRAVDWIQHWIETGSGLEPE